MAWDDLLDFFDPGVSDSGSGGLGDLFGNAASVASDALTGGGPTAAIDAANPATFADTAPPMFQDGGGTGGGPTPDQGQLPVGAARDDSGGPEARPAATAPAPSGARAVAPAPTAPPPHTAWESISQVPGKWWQAIQSAPNDAAQWVGNNPWKAMGAVAYPALSLLTSMTNRTQPASANPYVPRGPAPMPSSFNPVTDNLPPAGGPVNPILQSGGFRVRPSTGL